MFTRKNSTDVSKNASPSEPAGQPSFEPSLNKKVKVKAPKAPKDVYTLVLLLSFLFFTVASVFLWLDVSSYK